MISKCVSAVKQLEKARVTWLSDAQLEDAKRTAAQTLLQAKTTTAQTDEKEAHELRNRAEEAALVSIWCKTLPDAIPGDPKEVRRRLRAEENQKLRQEVMGAVRKVMENQIHESS
eukprot:5389520-Pyramimonas_sp.AAC.1